MPRAFARFLLLLAFLTTPARAHDNLASAFALAPSLAGTSWSASDVTGPVTYRFQPDGTLEYQYGNGDTFTNATWKQQGSRLYMEFNQKFSERLGRIHGEHILGEGWNKSGSRWLWDAHKSLRAD